jgi:hypothetical protein
LIFTATAGIVAGIGLFHHEKVYPVFVGSSGGVTGDSYSPVISGTCVHQSVSKLMV